LPTTAKLLFRPEVLHLHLSSFQLPGRVKTLGPKLAQWAEMIASGRVDSFKERELLPRFLSDFFYGILGYAGPDESPNRYTISLEKLVEVDGNFADAVIGNFLPSSQQYHIALEGKGPKDPLDRPFAGRRMSAVDQGYRYAINLPCDWIIVTSMRQTRLYHKGSDQYTYERFDTERLASDDNLLKEFVFLLGAERVAPQSGQCHLYDLLKASEAHGRELGKAFYIRYADIREDAFEHLRRDNPQAPVHGVLTGAQKILDRILFCAFSEDRGLLPPHSIDKAYEHTDPYNPRPVWDNFRGLFQAINTGSERLGIPKYNGGLFADDPVVDSLKVSDDICGYFRDLAQFDYRPAYEVARDAEAMKGSKLIDVDILGHIFEQSITDLEQLRNELDGKVERVGPERHKTRRKQEGAFYTPAFIARYIIEQALGSAIRDRFEQLRRSHERESNRTLQRVLADPNAYDLNTVNKPQRSALIRFWEAWQHELGSIRILDPACGSGAFLIEAFDQLHAQYQTSNDRLEELRGHRTLFDLDSHILLNNLFGVDVNEEAVEICKLSLWIKTAQRGKILTDLDKTIRVGNSVVNDPAIDPKAFSWRAAFAEVFAAGGFDVVVANPPYIRQEWLAPYKQHWEKRFKSYHGVADIFVYFFELGIGLLRQGGRLGFITSGSWVRSNSGGPLRKFLSEQVHIESMIDFGEYQPFEGAEMIRPTITAISKQPPAGSMRLFKWLTKGKPPENLSDEIQAAPSMSTDHLGAETWELESDEVRALREKLASAGQTLFAYTDGRFFRGVTSGLNEVFVINASIRQQLVLKDEKSADIIKPFIQGQHLRPWHIEHTEQFLIFARRGIDIKCYPAVMEYLATHRDKLEPKPSDWSEVRDGKWAGRKEGAYEWYEIQDSVEYWKAFEEVKIVWPDISKLPRFSMDTEHRYLGNTGYVIPGGDYYLLGVLASWATWFMISKTAQPLRLRGDRWQYRLIAQFMERLPIPEASDDEKETIGALAKLCNTLGQQRYDLQEHVRLRLAGAFGQHQRGTALGLNTKGQSWWDLSFNELGDSLKLSFKLKTNPFSSPRTGDEWEPYVLETRREVERMSNELANAEAELNDRVYRLFNLTPDEIKLLQREVEH
jgi:type I restriction-modification system DNA methylase subunit